MKLFTILPAHDRCGNVRYDVYLSWRGLAVIVAILVAWGFAVHVADRMIFG